MQPACQHDTQGQLAEWAALQVSGVHEQAVPMGHVIRAPGKAMYSTQIKGTGKAKTPTSLGLRGGTKGRQAGRRAQLPP